MENLLNNGYMWIMPVYKVNEIFLTEYLWIQFCTTTNDIFLSAILWHEPVTVVITFCKINKSKTLYYIGFSCHFLILWCCLSEWCPFCSLFFMEDYYSNQFFRLFFSRSLSHPYFFRIWIDCSFGVVSLNRALFLS